MRLPVYNQPLPGRHFNRSFHGIKTVGRILLGGLDHVISRLIQRSNHRYNRSVFDLVFGNGLVQALQHIIAFSQMKQNNVSCFPDMKCVHLTSSCFMKPFLCFLYLVLMYHKTYIQSFLYNNNLILFFPTHHLYDLLY